jgi:RES domain-containing protein
MSTSIRAWRITPKRYEDTAFSGLGAEEYGGRFNSDGTALVYTSESLALATLELLVRANDRRRLQDRVCLPVSFPSPHVTVLNAEDLPERWNSRPYTPDSQHVGDAWVESETSLVLRVPSVVVPVENNYLINPHHPDAADLEIGDAIPLPLDPRLPPDAPIG